MEFQTKNYGLIKRSHNMDIHNHNMDIIDKELKNQEGAAGELVVAHNTAPDAHADIREAQVELAGRLDQRSAGVLSVWSVDRTYALRELVVFDGAIYKSLQENNAGHGTDDAAWWVEYGGGAPRPEPEPEPEQVINYKLLYNAGDECAAETGGGWGNGNQLDGVPITNYYTEINKKNNYIEMNGFKGTGGYAALRSGLVDFQGYQRLSVLLDFTARKDRNPSNIDAGSA